MRLFEVAGGAEERPAGVLNLLILKLALGSGFLVSAQLSPRATAIVLNSATRCGAVVTTACSHRSRGGTIAASDSVDSSYDDNGGPQGSR